MGFGGVGVRWTIRYNLQWVHQIRYKYSMQGNDALHICLTLREI